MAISKLKTLLRGAAPPPSPSAVSTVRIGDADYRVDASFANRFACLDLHEEWLDAQYAAALEAKAGAFVDVGANTGQTLTKILGLDRTRDYVGFEPQLDCCLFIDQFIKGNNLSTHRLLPIGLSDHAGVVKLFKRRQDADSAASMVEGFRPNHFYHAAQYIAVARGDDILPQVDVSSVSTIKVDVEGGELEVLAGLQETMRAHSPFVFFEVLNHFLIMTGEPLDPAMIEFRDERNRRLERILRDLGYAIFNILPGRQMAEIREIRPKVSTDLTITDYVAVHENWRAAFFEHFEGTCIEPA